MYELKDEEIIFVFTGPDGSGRKTVADMIGSTLGVAKVISYTTRKRRPIEEEGQDYYFITREQFVEAQSRGEFVESLEIDGHLYGFKNSDIAELLNSHGSIYLISNRYGADILKELYGDKVIRIFLYADRQTVVQRQKESGLADDVIARHLIHYDEDMAYQSACEHSYENIDLGQIGSDVAKTLEGYLERDWVDKD